MKKEIGISVLLFVLCAITAIKNPAFLSATNLTNLANVIGLFGIFSIGLGLVIITGGIDLSVGSMFALCGVLLAMALREWMWPWWLAVLFVMVVPLLLGLVHGTLITRMRIQPFIVTLCGLLLYRGLARFIANDDTKGFGDAGGFELLREAARGRLLGVPMPFVILIVVAVVMWFVLHRSVY
jgi:ribose transport system permease protein